MYYKMFFRFVLIGLLIAGVSISAGCSQDGDQRKKAEAERVLQEKKREEIRERLREQIRKEQQDQSLSKIVIDDETVKKQRTKAESCMKTFQKCTETCRNDRCEDRCLEILSSCEKKLPAELQTLKKE
jgi:hypothetical protein